MSERMTCATKGCGAEIKWGQTSGKWFHNDIGLWGHLAHPAGGTNTTPPQELERDVKVTIDDLVEEMVKREKGMGCLTIEGVKYLIQCYADQAVEEATAEESRWLDEYNAQKKVMADLRDQLDRALVPKYVVGDRVTSGYANNGTITRIVGIRYGVLWDSTGHESDWAESRLAPLETETKDCNYWPHKFEDKPTRWEFCPLCGESLTKEGA